MDNTNKIYQEGEVLPTLPGVPTQVTNLSTPQSVIPTIEASKLGSAVGTIPATTIPNTANQNLGIQLSSSMIQPATPVATQTPAPAVDRNTILQSLMDLINKQGTRGEATISAQEDAGVFKQQEELTRLQNDYTAKEQAYLKQEEELNKNAEGLSEQGLKIRRDELSRKKNSELADISIQANMAKGLYDTAFSIAESKINAEFEPIQAQIDGLKNVYSFLQSDLSDSEKMTMQALIGEQQSAMDFERQKALIGYKAMIDSAMSGGSTSGISDLNAYVTAYQAGQIPLTQVPSGIRGQVLAQAQATGTSKMLGLLQEYRNVLSGLNYGTANLPKNKALLDGIKGQITATYKQQQQLGTLDAGVQKLIDQIIPDPSKLSISSLSNSAQLTALDNFIKNQGGTTEEVNPNEQIFQEVTGGGNFFSRLFKGIF